MCFKFFLKVLFLNSKINISIQFWPRWYLLDIYLSSGLTACPLLLEDEIDSKRQFLQCQVQFFLSDHCWTAKLYISKIKKIRYSLRLDMLCMDAYMYINTSKKITLHQRFCADWERLYPGASNPGL